MPKKPSAKPLKKSDVEPVLQVLAAARITHTERRLMEAALFMTTLRELLNMNRLNAAEAVVKLDEFIATFPRI